MNLFMQRVFLMAFGSALSYYVGVLLMNHSMNMDAYKTPSSSINLSPEVKQSLTWYEQSLLHCVTKPDDTIQFTDVIGHTEITEQLKSLVLYPLSNKDYFKYCKLLTPPNGILLHGPPGTGKTLIAKALASAFNGHFIHFDISVVENKLYGESLKLLSSLFSLASKIKPCIIFVDEIDGTFSKRNALDQSHVNTLKTQLLKELDGFVTKDPSIVFVAATNRMNDIDEALLRRLRMRFYVGLPGGDDIKKMLRYHLEFYGNVNYDTVAHLCKGMSGSDVKELCKLAAHKSAMRHKFQQFSISTEDVIEAIDEMF